MATAIYTRIRGVRACGLLFVLVCVVAGDGQFPASAKVDPSVRKLLADSTDCWVAEGETLPYPGPYWRRYISRANGPSGPEADATSDSQVVEQAKISIKLKDRTLTLHYVPCPAPRRAAAPPEPVKLYTIGTLFKPAAAANSWVPWTGFYAGGALGANWTRGNWITTDLRTLGTIDILLDAVKESEATNVAEEVYFGYMFWLGDPEWLAGVEADLAYYDALMDPGIPGTAGLLGNKTSDSVTMGARWSASLRGRLGYLVNSTTQIYLAAGPSLLSMNATINCTGPGVCGTNGIAAFSQTNSTTKVGWTLGGGVETILSGHLRGRAEYRYANYGTFSTSFGTPAQLALASGIKIHTSTVLLGLSYAFGGR